MSGTASATGTQPGDYLQLENQWARITITRADADDADHNWIVSGDIKDTRARSAGFTGASEALAYALESLALFQHGRAD